MSAGVEGPLLPPPVDEQPWYEVDLIGPRCRAQGCGPDCPEASLRQRVAGLAGPVAAWLRAQADLMDPPRMVTRSGLVRDVTPDEYRRRGPAPGEFGGAV